MRERRSIPRRHLMFHLRAFDADSGELLGSLVDISAAGFMLTGEIPLRPGERRNLRMNLPLEGFGSGALEFSATVAWSNDEVTPGLFDTGFRDLEMVPDERRRLESVIDEYDLRDTG